MSDGPSSSKAASLGRKGKKKRVGWHFARDDEGATGDEASDGGPGSALETPLSRDSGEWMLPLSGLESARLPLGSPGPPPTSQPPRSLDPRELRMALNKALVAEQDGNDKGRQNVFATIPEAPSPVPKALTPVFKRNTSYNGPEELEEADRAEMQTTERQVRAITDARQRADRLAVSTNTSSPRLEAGSRRSSAETDGGPSAQGRDTGLGDGPPPGFRRERRPSEHDIMAQHLVQSYSRRTPDSQQSYYQYQEPITPGTATPNFMRDYEQDYVPRPAKYRGGILASLLRLSRDDESERGRRSGFSTPNTMPATPIRSPEPSPPVSRRPSPTRTPSRLRTFGPRKSSSSATLTDYFRYSPTLAARSGDLSDQLVDKLKKKMTSSGAKKEQARITVHIAGILARHKYLLKLCRALMLYGAPTHRLEEYMTMSSRVLEIEGQFLYIPSCMIVSFGDSSTHTTEVKVVRVHQGVDLGRLRDVYNIYKDVVHDKMGVEEATELLEEVMERKPKFTKWIRVLMYGVASVCVAPFAFQGRFIDLPIAFFLGCVVGMLQLVFASSNELYAHVFEVSAALITSFLARAFGSIRNGELFCFSALAQSSIALILPGYMVLCGSLELQSYNIISGSVRMVHALIYTLFLGYGTTIGASLYGMLDKGATSATTCSQPLGHGWRTLMFVPAFTMCLCVINQAKWKQTPIMLFISMAGYVVNSYCSKYLEGNTQIPNMLGSLTVGLLANIYSRTGTRMKMAWFDLVEWWNANVRPRLTRLARSSKFPRRRQWADLDSISDAEKAHQEQHRKASHRHRVGYSLAAAAMLPAIFVQVPSGLAAGGSLLAGIDSADQINRNHTGSGNVSSSSTLDSTPFTVLFSVIQVAISLSVGLFLSALIVYPLGKRRSGLFSF